MMTISREELIPFIKENFFLLPNLTKTVTAIDIPGLKGWYSPLSQPMMNRVGFFEGNFKELFSRMNKEFSKRKLNFTWAFGDEVSEEDRREAIESVPLSKTCDISGMYTFDLQNTEPLSSDFLIQEAAPTEFKDETSLFGEMFGIDEDMARVLFTETFTPISPAYTSKVYEARDRKTGRIAAFAHMLYIQDSPIALLRVAAVKTEFRGKGIYKDLVKIRLSDAAKDGKTAAIIHAVKGGSSPICEKLGFQEISSYSLYHSNKEE